MNTMSRSCLLLVALMGACAPAVAQTVAPPVVEGAVTWPAAGSPYVVTSGLLVPSTASLTMEPGVVVHVAEGADIVVDGQLVAHGSTEAAVVITSDPGAPGANWGNLLLAGGGGTSLRHVEIAYGGGVLIQASSPLLSDVTLHHNAGPAITIDLASSPTGSGLVAHDNEVNGIVVAAGSGGRVSGDVVWALKGIPYVVRSMIDIGAQTFAFDPDRVTLAVGASVQLELRLPEPAASPLAIDIDSMAPLLVSVQPTTASFETGHDRATVTIQGLAASDEPVAVIAYRDGMPSAPASVRVLDLQGLTLLPSVAEVTVGGTVAMTVRAPTPAPSGGIEVAFARAGSCPSCVVKVPAVVIPANQTEASFAVEGAQIGSVLLRAQASGFAPAESQVTVRQPFVRMPVSFIVAPGSSRSLRVELSDVAPSATTVNLVAADPSLASIPATVVVPAGEPSALVPIQGGALAGETLLTASAAGLEASTTHLWVRQMALNFSAGPVIPIGFDDEAQVTLSGWVAPPGGLLVSLASALPGTAQVLESSVLIPADQTQSLPFRVLGVSQGGVELSAMAAGVQSGSHSLNVVGPLKARFNKPEVGVGVGLRTHVNEILIELGYGPDTALFTPRRAVSVALSNDSAASLAAPSVLNFEGGMHPSRSIQLTGMSATSTAAQLVANIDDYDDLPAVLAVNVVTPGLSFEGLDLRRAPGSPRDGFNLAWLVPGSSFPQAATMAISLPISIHQPDPAGIVGGIYGALSGEFIQTHLVFSANSWITNSGFVGTPTALGSYRVRAGTGALQTDSAEVLVSDRVVRLRAVTSDQVSPGLKYDNEPCSFRVSREIGDSPYHPPSPQDLTVNLSSSNPNVVPEDVVILGTNSSACIDVRVLGDASGSAQISAEVSNPDYQVQGSLTLQIVPASVQLLYLDGVRELGSPADDFSLRICTGPASESNDDCWRGKLLNAASVDLSIIESMPSDVVAGVTTQAVFPAGASWVDGLQVLAAQLVGEYRVRAQMSPSPALVVESAEQRVRIPELRLEWVDEIPPLSSGQGLRIGRGMVGRTARLSKILDGVPLPDNTCWWISPTLQGLVLTSSDTGKVAFSLPNLAPQGCGFPPRHETYGIALTDPGSPVQLNVQAPNHTSGAPLLAEVVEPVLVFNDLALVRPPGDGEDEFHLRWRIQGSEGQEHVSPHTEQTVEVVLTERNPPNVVSGLYVDPKAPSPGSQIELAMFAFGLESQWGYLGVTTGEGQYTVAATVEGYAPVEAEVDVQIFAPVAEPALRLHASRSIVHVGAGLMADPDELALELRNRHGVATLGRNLQLSVRCAATSLCGGPTSLTLRAGESRIAVPLRGLAPGATTLIVSAGDVALAEPVDVHVHVPELRIKPADPHARDPDQPVGLRVYAYVIKAQQPIQAPAQAWRVDLRAELSEAVLSADHAVIPAGALESDVVWLRTGGHGGVRVHASRPGARTGSSSLPPGGRP